MSSALLLRWLLSFHQSWNKHIHSEETVYAPHLAQFSTSKTAQESLTKSTVEPLKGTNFEHKFDTGKLKMLHTKKMYCII